MTRFEYMSHIFSCFGTLSILHGNIFMNHYLLILYLQPFVNIEYSSISISCERARDIDKYILLPKIYFTAENIFHCRKYISLQNYCRKYISLPKIYFTAENVFHCRKYISLPKVYSRSRNMRPTMHCFAKTKSRIVSRIVMQIIANDCCLRDEST